jgi:two-component system sensor histidine kinase KdpD
MPIDHDLNRPDPDALLARAERERRGRLKIFLGAAPGVGKTWEMLAAAARKRGEGVAVLAGVVETHGRAETAAMIGDLPILPAQKIHYRGQDLEEFDLDAALAARPGLLLVDELAHTNIPGLRHKKRWQDVREILEAGIDVWATLNIQHLESLNDSVARITGVRVGETVPDTVMDMADEIELIDLPPAELRARLTEGRVYRPDLARRALDGFFREGNLGALREMALRRAAQHVDRDVTRYMRARAIAGPWPAGERILALIGAHEAEGVVREAARLAEALRGPLLVLHLETGGDEASVQSALDLAISLGGEIKSLPGKASVAQLLDLAARENVTQIVLSRGRRHRFSWPGLSMAGQLARAGPGFGLHVVPVPSAPRPRPRPPREGIDFIPYALAAGLLALLTGVGILLHSILPQDAMGMIFIASVVGIASRFGRGPSLFTAIAGFLAWNFFFLPPVYTLSVADPRDVVGLIVFLAVGVVTGGLAGRVRLEAQAAEARVEALRRISLFGTMLGRAASQGELLRAIAHEAADMAQTGIVLIGEASGLVARAAEPAGTLLDDAALAAADFAHAQAIETGLGTETLPSNAWRFIPLRSEAGGIGVIGVRPGAAPSQPLGQALRALADQAAIALERLRLARAGAEARAMEDSQKLRTALLSSLSHDLRTPLTAIRGAAETLSSAGAALDEATRADLLASITQDTQRMTRFLANITDMARVETGEMVVKREILDLEPILEAAIARVPDAYHTSINIAPDAARLRADPTLLEQVFVNLLDNAVKFSPAGSRIAINARREGDRVAVAVADEGIGIGRDDLPLVFDRFFRARRGDRVAPGTGLGLSIAKAFTEACGGSISATSPRPDLPADGEPGTIIQVRLEAA